MSDEARLPMDTVLGKAVSVLRSFSVDRTLLSFAEIQLATGLPKSTTHRVLGDLVAVGLLDRHRDRYRLSRLVFELGMRASVERSLLEVSLPFLEELRERTRETVHLGVREGTEVVYVTKLGARQQAVSPSAIGGRMPLHATAIGKVLLAHAPAEERQEILTAPLRRITPRTVTAPGLLVTQLDQILTAGVAYEYEESAVGIVCVAAPVLGPQDEVLAAVSLTGPVTRMHPERLAPALQVTARSISATLGRRASLSRP